MKPALAHGYGEPAATGDQVAKVAAFSIRRPQLVGLLFSPSAGDTAPGLPR